jgi:adenine/guanine phosphoribosyltransferase-like PRPP-binding protein
MMSARDWIDTVKLLYEKEYVDKIVECFVKKTNEMKNDKYLLVGVDFPGIILCSLIALRTGFPFSYVISDRDKDHYSQQEINFEKGMFNNIILVTDVIVSGAMLIGVIKNLYEKWKIDSTNIKAIFSIFLRNAKCDKNINFSLNEFNVFCLNDEFDIEICNNKDKCLFKANDIDLYCNKPR